MKRKQPAKGAPGIIADGPLSARSKAYAAAEAQLVSEARIRHAKERAGASPLARIRLELKIRREVQAELRRRFPPHALYGAAPFGIRE